jgi:hypothetical protein
MKSKLIMLAMLLSFGASPCMAGPISVIGGISCGDWVKYRKKDDMSKLVSEARLVAFLSGLALASEVDILADANNESLYLWTDNYCQKNPLDTIYGSGQMLFLELAKKRR